MQMLDDDLVQLLVDAVGILALADGVGGGGGGGALHQRSHGLGPGPADLGDAVLDEGVQLFVGGVLHGRVQLRHAADGLDVVGIPHENLLKLLAGLEIAAILEIELAALEGDADLELVALLLGHEGGLARGRMESQLVHQAELALDLAAVLVHLVGGQDGRLHGAQGQQIIFQRQALAELQLARRIKQHDGLGELLALQFLRPLLADQPDQIVIGKTRGRNQFLGGQEVPLVVSFVEGVLRIDLGQNRAEIDAQILGTRDHGLEIVADRGEIRPAAFLVAIEDLQRLLQLVLGRKAIQQGLLRLGAAEALLGGVAGVLRHGQLVAGLAEGVLRGGENLGMLRALVPGGKLVARVKHRRPHLVQLTAVGGVGLDDVGEEVSPGVENSMLMMVSASVM